MNMNAVQIFLPLDTNVINENVVEANLILHSQNSIIHKSRFAVYVLSCYGMLDKGVYY